MEYVDLVNKIVAAEHSAQEIAREVKEKQDSLDADLKLEVGKLREDYFARAKHRIDEVGPARHGHHLGCGPAERPRNRGQVHLSLIHI